MEHISNIESLLSNGKSVQLSPDGYSMYPLFVPGRDQAIISPIGGRKLKKGDVVLYRRKASILVLHRIYKIKNNGYFMVGDNQIEVEGPLEREQIKGILTAFIRKGKQVSVSHPIYIVFSRIWLFMRPVRRVFQLGAAKVKKLFK